MNVFFRVCRYVLALLVVAPATAGIAGAQAAPKIPLDYRAYDSWRAIRGTVVSDDGRFAAYALVPEDGDPTLVVRDFQTGTDRTAARGIDPVFTADGRYVIYTLRPPNAEIRKAKRAHKKPDEQPKSGLGIIEAATGLTVTVDRVKSFRLPRDAGSDTVAYLLESPVPTPSAPASPGALPSPLRPMATATTAAIPSPSPTPTPDALHEREAGTTLVVRDLSSANETRIGFVTDYAVSHDGAAVAFATHASDGNHDGVSVRGTADGRIVALLSGPGHFKNLTFAPRTELLAFVSDAPTFAAIAPHYELYQSDLRGGIASATARVLVDGATGAFAAQPPSDNGKLRYSKDGARIFFGTAAAPTPVPSGTPEPMNVDIWNWQDIELQSMQRKDADDERKRTYTAVAATDGSRAAQLASGNVRDIIANENAMVALGIDDVRYRKASSWDLDFEDVYAISLEDGKRRLLIGRQRDEGTPPNDPFAEPSLSPRGGFVVAYDPAARVWFSVDTRTARRTVLTTKREPPFYDELDDHPAPPPPYGLAGWIDGDRYVLLRDRYDVWAVDPRSGAAARNITGGLGRKRHVVFTPEAPDPARDADSFDSGQPLVLDAVDDETKAHGIWRVALGGRAAFVPQPAFMVDKAVTLVARARAAQRIVVAEQTFSEMRNLWSASNLDSPLVRISDANPQQGRYRWGNEQLVSYRSSWGVPLRGILYTPDNLDPHKHYPMLVYFYERFSDLYHQMAFTTPAPNTSPTLVRYVSNGYVVFVPDVAYRTGHPGASAFGCILPGIDSIVKRGFIDPNRIGIAGHSWAAYQITYLLTRTNRFRAAEAGAAVANMTSAYGGIRLESGRVREFQYEVSQSRIGATPWDRTDLYIENSALFHIRNVNTPYLTIANDLDGAVPQSQGIEFFTALRRLGKEAYLFSFDGEDHNLKGREQQKYWTVHLDEFFDHFLLGKPAPDWMTHGVDYLHRGQRDIDTTRYGETP